MRKPCARVIVWSASVCWLVCSQQLVAQSSTVVHTVLRNPNPVGIFTNELGVPVYNNGLGGSSSFLSLDLNQDGTVDYNVVATGTVSFGFQLDGIGQNSTWARPAGGNDLNSFVVPLSAGTSIGAVLPTPDQWISGKDTPFGRSAPGISTYSTLGGLGLFIDQTAYAGLQFYIGADVHYGWVLIQEIPFLAGGGIVYEYAYDTSPNTPILAGAIPEPSTWALLVVGGAFLLVRRKECIPT